MKKLLLLVFSCFFTFHVQSQKTHSSLSKFKESYTYALCTSSMTADFCQASFVVPDSLKGKEQILKVVFPKWEEKSDTVFEILPYRNIMVKDAAMTVKFLAPDKNCYGQGFVRNCVNIVIFKTPTKYFNTSFIEGDFKILKVQKLVRPASIELLDTIFTEIEPQFIKLGLPESDIMYFRDNENNIIYAKLKPEVFWGEWLEYFCSAGSPTSPSLKSVCHILKEKGYYSGPDVYRMTPDMKDALIRFQKDKGLPRGSLDFETLKALSYSRPLTLFSEAEKLTHTLNKW